MSNEISVWGAVTAWLGVLVSFLFSRRSLKASKEANRIQEEMLALQRQQVAEAAAARKKADIRVELRPQGDHHTSIVVKNLGPGAALNVHIAFKGTADGLARYVLEPLGLPYPKLSPGAELPMTAHVRPEELGRLLNPMELSWENEDGTPGEHSTNI